MIKKIIKKIKERIVKKHIFNRIKKDDKILFVTRVDLIGDYVASKDFLRILRNSNRFKNYKIILCANKSVKDFILDFDKKYIDMYIEFDTCRYIQHVYRKYLYKAINKYKYEYVLNYMSVRNEWSEEIIKHIKTGIKYGIVGKDWNLGAGKKQTYDKCYDKLFDTTCEYDLCGLEFINLLTNANEDDKKYIHHFELNPKTLEKFREKYSKPYAVIFPSASEKKKRMPFDKYIQLMKFLYDKYRIISFILGSKKDNEILQDYNINALPYIINLCGKYKLSQLPYFFKNAKMVLTNDTCAMHIARCVNTNSIVFSNVHFPNAPCLNVIKNENEDIYLWNRDSWFIINPQDFYYDLISNKPIKPEYAIENIELNNAFYAIKLLLSEM